MTPVNVFNCSLIRYAVCEAERSGLARTFRHAVIAASRHGGFVPFVRRLKRRTSRDKGYRQKHSVRGAANDMTTDFALRFHLFLHSSVEIPR